MYIFMKQVMCGIGQSLYILFGSIYDYIYDYIYQYMIV